MSKFQTAGTGFPAVLPLEIPVPVLWPSVAVDPAVRVPSPFTPVFTVPLVEPAAAANNSFQLCQKESRRFFLERSVFDMVNAYNEIALTDSRLLQWYLCLSPEDKNIIKEDGSFYNFLQRHPGLELSQSHISVKYRYGHHFLPAMTSGQQIFQMPGSQMYECGNEASVSDRFHGLMEEDRSILISLPNDDLKAHGAETYSCPVTVAAAAGCKMPKSDQQVACTMPRPLTCVAAVSTEEIKCVSAHTQTETPGCHDAGHAYMGDTYKLAEDFIKVKMTPEETSESGACKVTNCDGMRRAQRAELSLLTLQYHMCRQHIWRLSYTSAEGNHLNMMPQDPPANIVGILQELESDYNEMKRQILMGVPLEQLKPLFVDSQKITVGARYVPAEAIGDLLGNVTSWTSQEPLKHEAVGESGDDGGRDSCQVAPHGGDIHQSQKQKKQMSKEKPSFIVLTSEVVDEIVPACGEVSSSEMWYDAEEELQLQQPETDAEVGQDPNSFHESSSDEANNSVLSSHVTRGEFLPPEVTSSASNDDLRVPTAKVMDQSEEAAREMNGQMHSHSLHKEILSIHTKSSQDTDTPQSEKKPMTLPLSSRIRTRKVVCISPTAKETCVPQHFGTMGSINTLTDELMQRHPDAGRQRIVDALMELRATHPGVLSSLPLRTIRDMTSELLTRPATTSET